MKVKNFKTELAKLKDMSLKDRLWYIWEYYKLWLLALVFIIFLIFEMTSWIYRNMQDTMLYCLIINEPKVSSFEVSNLQHSFETLEGFDKDWKKTTEFDSSLSIAASSEELSDFFYSSASTIKLEALAATDSIDVLITVPTMLEYYTSQNLFIDIASVLPDDIVSRLTAEDRIISGRNSDGNSLSCAVSLDDSYLSTLIPLDDNSSLSICTDKNYPDIIIDFIRYAVWGE